MAKPAGPDDPRGSHVAVLPRLAPILTSVPSAAITNGNAQRRSDPKRNDQRFERSAPITACVGTT